MLVCPTVGPWFLVLGGRQVTEELIGSSRLIEKTAAGLFVG
jgi:hypothetical protein